MPLLQNDFHLTCIWSIIDLMIVQKDGVISFLRKSVQTNRYTMKCLVLFRIIYINNAKNHQSTNNPRKLFLYNYEKVLVVDYCPLLYILLSLKETTHKLTI